MFEWSDFRHFLAVARTGSTFAAAKQLGVSQTTTARRIAALEEALRLTLFNRSQSGYLLTKDGQSVLEHARKLEAAASEITACVSVLRRESGGSVKLTADELYVGTVLAPLLREFREQHPDILIEIDTTEEVRDLADGTADVALRSAVSLSGSGLVARRIASDPWTVYCSQSYAAANGVPRNRHELKRHVLVGSGQVWRYYTAWLQASGLEDAVVLQQSSPLALLSSVRAGVGLAALPTFVGDREPDLVRCLPPHSDDKVSLWLVTHERVRRTRPVRAVMDFLGDRLAALARQSDPFALGLEKPGSHDPRPGPG